MDGRYDRRERISYLDNIVPTGRELWKAARCLLLKMLQWADGFLDMFSGFKIPFKTFKGNSFAVVYCSNKNR